MISSTIVASGLAPANTKLSSLISQDNEKVFFCDYRRLAAHVLVYGKQGEAG